MRDDITFAASEIHPGIHINPHMNFDSNETAYSGYSIKRNVDFIIRACIVSCAIAYAHAIQLLDRNNSYSASADCHRILRMLLDVNNTPPSAYADYNLFLVNTFGFRLTDMARTVASKEWYMDHFHAGGVIICHVNWAASEGDPTCGGHYCLASGCRMKDDGELYIHMIDSNSGSTFERIRSYADPTGETVKKAEPGTRTGDEYWIPLSSFSVVKGLTPEEFPWVSYRYPADRKERRGVIY